MASTAGYLSTVYVVAIGGGVPPTAVGGCKSISDEDGYTLLDTTAFGGTGDKTSILGLRGRSITLNCDYVAADAGQVILRAAARAGCVLKILHDGTNGFYCNVQVEKKPLKTDPNGLVSQDFTLSSNGAQTAVP